MLSSPLPVRHIIPLSLLYCPFFSFFLFFLFFFDLFAITQSLIFYALFPVKLLVFFAFFLHCREFYAVYLYLIDRRPPASSPSALEKKTQEGEGKSDSSSTSTSTSAAGAVEEMKLASSAPPPPPADDFDDAICPICFDSEATTQLPCSHAFCWDCIADWYVFTTCTALSYCTFKYP